MNVRQIILLTFLTAGLLTACTSNEERKARMEFMRIDSWTAAGELPEAMQLLDSMMVWYKDHYGLVGEALKRRQIIAADYYKSLNAKSETRLAELEPLIAQLSRKFQFTPGEPGQPGLYVHRRQTVESSWNRTFLKIVFNEAGDIWLVSHYYGNDWIDQTSLRVYDSDQYILTDTIPLGHEWNRKVEDLDDKWETVEFREGSDAGAIAFIADNWQKPVKARLTGKTFQYIVLESFDKEAIRDGWELAQLLKERWGLRESVKANLSEIRRAGG